MSNTRTNQLGQPIGAPVPGWKAPPRPPREATAGTYCRLEPLDDHHADQLFAANRADRSDRMWTYLAYGPFETLDSYREWVSRMAQTDDPLFFTVIDANTGTASGVASYLRIDQAAGAIEVGHIAFAPSLQRTRAATEAMYLMMRRVFTLGYRRYEWKCDALNAPSRAAAGDSGFPTRASFVRRPCTRTQSGYGVVRHHRFRMGGARPRISPMAGR